MPDGSGTAANPYVIHNADDWNVFRAYCDADITAGKYFKLANNITVTTSAGIDSHDFQGIFDGNGKNLTFNYGDTNKVAANDYAAPFAYVKNATIKNLRTTGTIYTSGKFASGLVGGLWGDVTIENCRIGTVIRTETVGDGTHGGFIALQNSGASVKFKGCLYNGKLLSAGTKETTNCGGFVGYNNGMLYGGQMLYGYGDKVELTLAYDSSITNFDKYTVSAGELDGNILTMPNENVTVSVKLKIAVTLSASVSPDGVGDICDIQKRILHVFLLFNSVFHICRACTGRFQRIRRF